MATLVAGVIIMNIAAIVGAYVSVKVSITELKVRSIQMEKDINNLGAILRELRN